MVPSGVSARNRMVGGYRVFEDGQDTGARRGRLCWRSISTGEVRQHHLHGLSAFERGLGAEGALCYGQARDVGAVPRGRQRRSGM
jgi:hypothetical protein